MVEADISKLLVIGADIVSLAYSARRAGYIVYAADYFGDQDLRHVCREIQSIIKQRAGATLGEFSKGFNPRVLVKLTRYLLKKNKINGVLISSGLDDASDVLFTLNDMVPIIGNDPHVIRKTRDKMKFFQELESIGILHPETDIAEDREEALRKSKDVGYPLVVKPLCGFGGQGIKIVQNHRELIRALQEGYTMNENVLIQRFIPGIPASASLISCPNRAMTLTLNEQLLGMRQVGQREPFGYCGNLVPLLLDETLANRCKSVVEKTAVHFGLVGSNGVDFVISREGVPYVIEVNPRFQASLECVERVLGINMVEAHVNACLKGTLPSITKKTSVFCVRLILFSRGRSIVPEISVLKNFRDVPLPGVVVEDGEPICSIVLEGANRNSLLRNAKKWLNLYRVCIIVFGLFFLGGELF